MFHRLSLIIILFALSLIAGSQSVQAAQEEAKKTERAPDKFKVKFETTAGDFIVEATRKWAPIGVDHFHKAIKSGFYNECRFFRVVPGFVVQFGINGDPKVQAKWREDNIKDEKVIESNKRGYLTYAKSGAPDSRTTQLFISYRDNSFLDRMGFSPFAKVIEGMENVDKIYSRYGERPEQGLIQRNGNAYLKAEFPKLDYIKKATIMEDKKENDQKENE